MRFVRSLLAALAAGLLLNATGSLLAHFVLGDYVRTLIARVGSSPEWAPLAHLAMRFAIGSRLLVPALSADAEPRPWGRETSPPVLS